MEERPSRAFRLILLEDAVLCTAQRYGLPSTAESQAFFDTEVDVLYRLLLLAHRRVPESSFEARSHRVIINGMTLQHGAAYAKRAFAEYVNAKANRLRAT